MHVMYCDDMLLKTDPCPQPCLVIRIDLNTTRIEKLSDCKVWLSSLLDTCSWDMACMGAILSAKMSSQQEQRNVKESHTEEAEPNQAQVDETEQVPAAEQDVDQTAQTPEEGKSYADAAAEESLKVSKDEQDEVMQKLGADSTLEASAEGEELKVRPKEL
ncbi:hypothetical protein AXG93_2189s1320 [Marchantia polymorpha subsp. ruderalis]|uniref:Uncharacterized protein n=2 Tax=Marchantia polymorpha subsp. ruderalis TaxID=1480154 RepID=A0A176WQT8_MARPO|nr:hypothetical protein AXG93_2189s1320 [Marchantia polymorpha subsp. ruderalis]